MTFRDLILASLAVVVLGVNIVAIKLAVGFAPPLLVTGLRFLAVGLALAWFFPFPKQLWRQVLVLSVVQGLIHHGLMFIAFEGVDAVVAAIIIQLRSPFAVIFAWVILGEKFGLWRTTGMSSCTTMPSWMLSFRAYGMRATIGTVWGSGRCSG